MKNSTRKLSIDGAATPANNFLGLARDIYEEDAKRNHDIKVKRLDIISDSDNQFFATMNTVLSGINEELQNPNLSDEERKNLSADRRRIVDKVDKKNTEIGLREFEIIRRDTTERQQKFCNIATFSCYLLLAGACAYGWIRPNALKRINFPNLLY